MIRGQSISTRQIQRAVMALSALAGVSSAAGTDVRAAAPPLRECIDPSAGASWTAFDDHSILVRSSGRSFLVTTSPCPRLAAPMTRISVEEAGATPMCSPNDVHLFVSDGAGRTPVRCFVQDITRLAEDQARAIASGKR